MKFGKFARRRGVSEKFREANEVRRHDKCGKAFLEEIVIFQNDHVEFGAVQECVDLVNLVIHTHLLANIGFDKTEKELSIIRYKGYYLARIQYIHTSL